MEPNLIRYGEKDGTKVSLLKDSVSGKLYAKITDSQKNIQVTLQCPNNSNPKAFWRYARKKARTLTGLTWETEPRRFNN